MRSVQNQTLPQILRSQQEMRTTPVQLHNQAVVGLHRHNVPAQIVELGPIVQILQQHAHATEHRAECHNPSEAEADAAVFCVFGGFLMDRCFFLLKKNCPQCVFQKTNFALCVKTLLPPQGK